MNPAPAELPVPELESTPPEETTPTPAPAVFQMTEEDLALLRGSLTGTLMEREADVLSWYQALPRLLAEGEEGRYALMYDGQVVSIWDTLGDAIQAGLEKFGVDDHRFSAPCVKQRELDKLKMFLAQERANRCPK
jgi:hypothetical protein